MSVVDEDIAALKDSDVSVPAAKLAAVTKKKNSIEEILRNDPPNENRIRQLYNEYLLKVEILYVAADKGNHDEWLAPHKEQIDKFRDKVQVILSTIRSPSVARSRSVRSSSSRLSVSSSSSSARIKLAEKRAKVAADRKFLQKSKEIEEKELEVKLEQLQQERKLKNLQLEKKKAEIDCSELENEMLETELNNIDRETSSEQSSICSDRSLIYSVKPKKRLPSSSQGDDLVRVLAKQNDISKKLVLQHEQSTLPKQHILIFDGSDITDYKIFKQNFYRMIETKCSNDADRLCYLEQYTSGAAREFVRSCVHSDPSKAYKEAKVLLDREYDNEYKVAATYLSKLSEWSVIKSEDVPALQSLYTYLLKCNNYLENSSPGNQINNPQEIMKIVSKLPHRMKDGWRRRTFSLQEDMRLITFSHFVEFVGRELRVMKQPLFGVIIDPLNSNAKPKERVKRNFVTSTDANEDDMIDACECCKKTNHSISQCIFFKSKTHKEKSEFVKKLGLCFGCLSRGHISRFCRKREVCSECNGSHPTILHNNDVARTHHNYNEAEEDEVDHSCGSVKANPLIGAGFKKVICPIVPAKVKCEYGDREILINIALDTHSSDCWMSENLVAKLGANPTKTTILLSTMENVKNRVSTSFLEQLQISSIDGTKRTEIPMVYTKKQSHWPFSKNDIPTYHDVAQFEHLSDVPFDFIEANIDLLVGMNVPGLVKCHGTVDGGWDEPFASLHWLGWAFNGSVDRSNTVSSCKRTVSNSIEIERHIEKLFANDFPVFEHGDGNSIEDSLWLNKVKSSLQRLPSGNYQIGFPFRNEKVSFPSNRKFVYDRFMSIKRRFNNDPEYFSQYKTFMNMMIEKGFAEEIPREELVTRPGDVWYLPHHAVFHKQKRKIRVVFNCSAKFYGTSLNDELMQGPDLANNLLGVLLRFRGDNFAFVGDIEKMYYEIKVPKEQWDYMRFFWLDCDNIVKEFRLTVHVFGARSSPSVANFALKQTAIDHAIDSDVRDAIFYNFYVDDLLKSCTTQDESVAMFRNIKATLEGGGFNLTGYCSNFDNIEQNFALEDIAIKSQDADCISHSSRTLGLRWETKKDFFEFQYTPKTYVQTRRSLLRAIASIYDPLGIISPVIICARRIFQETCRLRLSWDEPLPQHLYLAWKRWENSIIDSPNCEIPRSLKHSMPTSGIKSTELHIFCDGSETAYGAVAYVKFILSDNICVSPPVLAKARLTPLNNSTVKTIPRIELCGAKIAVDVARSVTNELKYKFDKLMFWTDSTTVLGYITNESKRFHRFVSNKVAYIRSHSSPSDWHHVSSENNPADLVSRGCTMDVLFASELWNKGPKILSSPHVTAGNSDVFLVSENDDEIRKEKLSLSTKINHVSAAEILVTSSSWYKIKVRVAWFHRFIKFLSKTGDVHGKLSVDDIEKAEISIIRYSQGISFPELRLSLQQNKVRTRELQKLNLFIDDDDLIRVGGRLKCAQASFSFRHPVLLSSKSEIVVALVEYAHRSLGHMGRQTVAAFLRKKYWIVSGNSLIKKIVNSCVTCRKQQARPIAQMMSDLPGERITGDVSAFSNVGVDYFGPFATVHGRKTEKKYGVIFTCLASRAVHIEVAPALCTNSYINALRRFISRRGNVRKIFSDQGTNFVGANRELKEALRSWNLNAVEDFLKQRDIEWKFNIPCSSNYGGIWERIIRIIRKVLNSLLSEQRIRLTNDNLCTLMCEVESIINSRPLTPVSDDPNDCEAITPNHLLLLNSNVSYPPGLFIESDLYSRRRWRQVQYLANIFWSRWRKEYITLLQSRQKWLVEKSPLEEGDLVLLVDNFLPRNQWPLGRIVKMLKSSDGRFRSAKLLLTKYKDSSVVRLGTITIERPVNKLIKLLSDK